MEELNLWFEKYRPKKLDDCILTKKMKDIFQGYGYNIILIKIQIMIKEI